MLCGSRRGRRRRSGSSSGGRKLRGRHLRRRRLWPHAGFGNHIGRSHLPCHHLTVRSKEHSSTARGKLVRMAIEKLSAVTFRVANMTESVRFYRDVLGMKLLYGGEDTSFSSLRSENPQSAI